METKILTKYRLILAVVICSLTSSNAFAQYDVMEINEVTFTSQGSYTNPYLEVDVWIDLNGPASEQYRIPVFWDGGNTFRARLVATSVGTWNWSVDNSTVPNSDQGFIGQSGSFTASAADTSSNPNNRGFIRVASNNRTLEYADGTPFFYTADTSWSSLTKVFGFTTANTMTEISFQDYFTARKNQGFNGLNVIASFPNDTYTNLWSSETWGQKTGPNGETPFVVNGVVDYQQINPSYWQSVDIKMQYLADQGFVTMLETVRRSEDWPTRTQAEKDAFYNYVRYLWARYGCYNMIFSWVHHDTNSGNVYPLWLQLVQHANTELQTKIGAYKMPYGQPRTAMSFNTSLNNWNIDVPTALDIQNVSNAERDETMHEWLSDIYDQVAQPALNLEPFYPGWGLHSSNEINPGLDDITMGQMQMYGSVLSGGLAGHAWGDTWYAGAAHATSNRVVPENSPQLNALTSFESQAMGHLRSFILDSGHEYDRLIPAADANLSNSQNFVHTLSISDDKAFALGFFTTSYALPNLTNLTASETYQFEWWDVTNGGWTNAGNLSADGNGLLVPPALPDNTKNWAYRIRSENYNPGTGCGNTAFALRINTGGSTATYNGDTFVADVHFDTGSTLDRPQTGLTEPYKTFRYSTSEVMGYDIPLPNGDYTLRLHFAELWFGATGGGAGGVGSRVFDVSAEGQLIEDNLDVFDEVGAETMLIRTHNVSVTDGTLNIDFDSRDVVGGERHPIINAIEVLGTSVPIADAGQDQVVVLPNNNIDLTGTGCDPDGGSVTYLWSQTAGPSGATLTGTNTETLSVSGLVEGSYTFQLTVTDDETDTASDTVNVTVDPESNFALRINTGGNSTTYNGDTFVADIYFDTGSTLDRPQTGLPEPYKTFRYSTSEIMGYDIPLANGDYTVNLHFAELWFGATGGGAGGVGSRVFDVSAEGQLIEDNLDVFDEVGAETMLVRTHSVTVSDGTLNIDFDSRDVVGGERHPIINAIEVLGVTAQTSLVGHWPLDEQSGTSASDLSGQGHTGTLENGQTFDNDRTTGQVDGALLFDGTDDRINLPDIDDNLQSGFTVSAWVNPANAAGGYQGVVGSTTAGGFMMFINQSKLGFKVTTNENGQKLVSSGSIQSNVWQMVTCTYDGSNMRWYIDGTIVHTEPLSGTLKDTNVAWIGWSGWSSEYFDGGIDAVKIFDGPLSDNEINDLYTADLQSMPNASGHWPLDEQNGTTAADLSGQSLTGTLENGLTFDNDKTTGQIGGALVFDGTDDRVSLPDIDDNMQTAFTTSAWVNPTNAAGGYQGVVGSTTASGFMMFINQSKLGFKVTTNENGQKLQSHGSVQNNAWQMVTCTFDGSDMQWYIDGVSVHTESHSGTLADRSTGWIGWSGWSNEYFEGGIDDVRLYD
ncbi:MAG: malectin domain-containing carbohydrate-binding protein, partial [Flavobacteriaceae bacterium]